MSKQILPAASLRSTNRLPAARAWVERSNHLIRMALWSIARAIFGAASDFLPALREASMLPAKFGAQSREGLETAFGVAGKAHDHVFGAGIGKALEKRGGASSRAGVAGLTSAHDRRRLTVIIFEKSVDPLFGAAGILVDRQCQIHRGDKFIEIAAGVADDRLHFPPLLGPTGEARRVGEPAVKMPSGALEGRTDRPGEPDRRTTRTIRCRAEHAALDPPAPVPVDGLPGPQGAGEAAALHPAADPR